jgi:hypothetical protein
VRLLGLCLIGTITLVSCQKSLEKQVHEQIRTLDDARLEDEDIEVVRVRQSGSQALADVTIKTVVRLRKEGNKWVLKDVRLGDRRWESVDRILRAIHEDRCNETRQEMEQIGEGVRNYRKRHGEVPQLSSFEKLIDTLCPNYLGKVIRIDAWWNPFFYRAIGESQFELRSAGADGRLGTDDDLVSD